MATADRPPYLAPGWQRWLDPRGLHLDGNYLAYDRAATLAGAAELTANGEGRVMVERFMQLERGTDEAVLAFANDYGVLGLCRHGQIHTACTEVDPDDEDHDGEVLYVDNPADHEPLSEWRRWSALVAAIVGAARIAANGQTVGAMRLEELLEYGTYGQWRLEDVGNNVTVCRSAVAAACTRMLREGEVGLVLKWDVRLNLPQLMVGATVPDAGMFGGLALEVALVCSTAGRVYTCAGCGTVFTPRRRPAAGHKSWCDEPDCKKARQRYADARRPPRKKAARDK